MGPDKLEYLLDCFIERRRGIDCFDGYPVGTAEVNHACDIGSSIHHGNLNADSSYYSQDHKTGGSIASSSHALAQAIQAPQVSELGQRLLNLANQFAVPQQNSSFVKFEKSCIIVAPKEQTISVTVKRSSVPEGTITKVMWETLDKTAFSGTHYIGSSGQIVFETGIMEKTFEIKILQSSDDTTDLRFNIKMTVVDRDFAPQFMTVTLKNINDFYDDERQVINSLPAPPFTVEDIMSILDISLNPRTFHMALTHLCSAADSVHMEYAVALDLSQLCLRKLQRASIMKVLRNFFRTEDIED